MKTQIKELSKDKQRILLLILGIGVFLAFALMSRWTPTAGDDWVYAVGGREHNPFAQAWAMYFTWSGRLLSELWGYLIAPHKKIWNILNPLLFTTIFFMMLKFACRPDGTHPVLTGLLAVTLMFSVSNTLRMQTYTWIMGTTYVIPLVLFLIYIVLLKGFVFENDRNPRKQVLMAVLNVCIPLYMENAAALVCGADLLVLIYLFVCDRRKFKPMLGVALCGIAGTLVILLSPGAASRLSGSNADFGALSFLEKFSLNWPLFLEHTFSEHKAIVMSVFLTAGFFVLDQRIHSSFPKEWMLLCILFFTAAFVRVSWFRLLAVLVLIYALIVYCSDRAVRWSAVFLVLCAIGADLVMVMSPIFDSRSTLYTCYLWILLVLLLFEQIKPSAPAIYCTAIGLLIVDCVLGASYYKLYHLVHMIDVKRSSEIAYYSRRPDAGDAWILAYPDEVIHSPNVLEGDEVHDRAFKAYYYLNEDMQLHFYYLEEYNGETIFGDQQ